jgi:pSer/pThr/pTyr-binding forkhead associated (FHA) protein/S1-C subfamily serine protease
MPLLRLHDEASATELRFSGSEVRIGRATDLELTVVGEGRRVVSGYHARLYFEGDAWWIEDAGSRNGTYLDDIRLEPGRPAALRTGAAFQLGRSGPCYSVLELSRQRLSDTYVEDLPSVTEVVQAVAEALDDGDRNEAKPAAAPPHLVLRRSHTGQRFEVRRARVRLGRGRECEVRPVDEGDTSVSRIHAEIEFTADGSVVVRDAGSLNGTYLNDSQLRDDHTLESGDRLALGQLGPELLVEKLWEVVEPPMSEPKPGARQPTGSPEVPDVPNGARRSYGGKGATVFFRDLFEESSRKNRARIRLIVWSFVGVLVVGVGTVYWLSEQQLRRTEQQFAEQRQLLEEQRARSDSLRRAAQEEYDRLGEELERARGAAAPADVLDSLRQALADAQARTDALESALRRAQASLDRQLGVGDSLQRLAQAELARLRLDLNDARASAESAALLDSLRSAVQDAEQRAADIEARLGAVRGVDFATLADANQEAIGLVTVFIADAVYDGTGFVITPSGYLVTNRHLVLVDGQRVDSVYVTMAEQARRQLADVVAVGPPDGPDLALLRVRDYAGHHVRKVDWTGSRMRQGAPAALIGFPAGMAGALDASFTVRASMSAGIFSKVAADVVQFDGFTVTGSSGSPIFNANGEVVAVHRAGLREAVGLGFAVPISQLVPLLPQPLRIELGVP